VQTAVITDIHANLTALEAVLAEIDALGVEEIWCLGDVVGYGAEPDACTDLVRERAQVCLVGNHDIAVLGALDISSFSEAAAEAVKWTREHVSEQTLEFLRGLDPDEEREGLGLFHASPRDPIWEYVLSYEQAYANLTAQSRPISLVGHSHVSLFFAMPEDGGLADVRGGQVGDGNSVDLSSGRWLLNPGSVGQPRDGDPRAAWLQLDTESLSATFHRVGYDIEKAAAAIVQAGLPERLAERLEVGQ
jgi:diadenosine tetraphosphatase ApaH/serine/threonine PP2A family protein phosphatase